MKREIKRLQRLRDLFRQNVNNPAVAEQHKLVEARKRIENVSYPLKYYPPISSSRSNPVPWMSRQSKSWFHR